MSRLNQDAMVHKYFDNDQLGRVFLLVLANGEMSIDQAIRVVCDFKNTQLREQFTVAEDISSFRLFPGEDTMGTKLGGITQESIGLLQQLRKSLHEAVDRPQESYSLVRTGLMKEMKVTLRDVKVNWIANHRLLRQKSAEKIEYLKALMKEIIEKFNKDSDEEVFQQIIRYGGIDPVITDPLIAKNRGFREIFTNIIYNCKTFKQLKLYRGEDIQWRRAELVDDLTVSLIQLEFNEDAAEAIINELIKRPLSNIVANRSDLTNQQKQSFYRSDFYKSGRLIKYAQILNYQQSLEFKVKEEIGKILKIIEDQAKVTKEIVECLIGIRFFSLLQNLTVKPIKTKIFKFVMENCPNYVKAFKIVQYQGKQATTLRENEGDYLRIELINIFQKINLQFDEWELAQDKIMSRRYSVIDDLTLKRTGKHDLMQHIMSNIEPYFHQLEKEMSYRHQMELVLMQAIMETSILAEINFEEILIIIKQTLDSQNYSSEFITKFKKGMFSLYRGVLSNPKFREYAANNRRDLKEEQYTKRWQLKRQILKNNYEDKIDVTYQAIDELVEKIIMDHGRLPAIYHQHVTNLSKLKVDPIEPVEKNSQQKNTERLTKKFNEASQILYKAYIANQDNSFLEVCFKTMFDQNAGNLVRKMIETRVFQDEDSTFFSDLGYGYIHGRRFRREIWNMTDILKSQIQECTDILRRLSPQGLSWDIPLPDYDSIDDFRVRCAAFVKKYQDEIEESMFQRVLKEKYDGDCARFVIALKAEKAFINFDSNFFNNLGYNKLQIKKMKLQFAKNAEWALKQLDALE